MTPSSTPPEIASPPRRRRAALVQLTVGYVNIGLFIIQGIVLVPLYLRHIGSHLYGLWLATGGVTFWLNMVDFGLASLMGQRIAAAHGRKDAQALCLYYSNGLILQLATMLLLVLLGAAAAMGLPWFLHLRGQEVSTLRAAALLATASLGLTLLNNGQKNAADSLQRPLIPSLMNVVGRLVAIGTTVALLAGGAGLYAIPGGLLAGAALTLAVNSVYVFALMRRIGGSLRPDRAVLRDMLHLSPSLFLGKASYALVGQLEPTLITHYLSPEAAVAWTITKRGADIIQIVLDNAVGAVRPGFAHLFAEGNPSRIAHVLRSFIASCFAAIVLMLTAYVAANRTFISLWVGPGHFAGLKITLLVASAAFALHFNSSLSTLLGATGDFLRPSLLNAAESVVRVVLMVSLLTRFGMAGLPAAVTVSAGACAVIYGKQLLRRLGLPRPSAPLLAKNAAFGLSILSLAVVLGRAWRLQSWPGLGLLLALVALPAGLALVLGNPSLRLKLQSRLKPVEAASA